jgi:hypothetical protein
MSEGQRTGEGLGRRIVVTTTVAPETHAFFKEHREYVVGRALDVWVQEQVGKTAEAEEEKWARRLRSIDLGQCSCGRIVVPILKRKREECAGCAKPPKECSCAPSLELRRVQLIEWQKARSAAGLRTDEDDLEAKRIELGLVLPKKVTAYMAAKAQEATTDGPPRFK